MAIENNWKPEVVDWEEIPLETYKFLFERAEKKFEETVSECESITNKSTKLLTGIVLAIPFFIGLDFVRVPYIYGLIFGTIYVVDLIILIKLLFPKAMVMRGSPPNEIVKSYLENKDYSIEEKKIIPYYHELIRIQAGIDHNNKVNAGRIEEYRAAIIVSSIILSIGIFAGVISHL